MNLALTEDQRMIRESAESFLADASSSAAVRAAMATAAGYDEGVWNRIAGELGWCALAVPESCGGLGLGPVEQVLLFEQMGRYLLCAPYFSTVALAAGLLQHAADDAAQQEFLPAIAEGRLRASAALPSGPLRSAAAGLSARQQGTQWRLHGAAPRVPDGTSAQLLLLPALDAAGETGLFAVQADAPGVHRSALDGWDRTRRFAALQLHDVPARRIDRAADFAAGLQRAEALLQLHLAAEALGGAQQCLDLTVAYTAGRKQFGRFIASFQAVKHRCAEMMVKLEALRSAVAGAAAIAADAQAAPQALAMECAMAKALAAETYFWCAQEAVQLHGGVGFTWEYDPQLHFKRAQASSHWLGSAAALREQLAAQLLGEAA